MIVTLVVAAAENGVIGRDNALPWRLASDLRRFRALTAGKPVIMGRKTHASIGRLLPGRRNIVVTRTGSVLPGAEVAPSLPDALRMAERDAPEEVCVVGGGELFREALPLAGRVELTRVHAEVPGDVTFPELSSDQWKEVAREEHPAGPDDEHPFTYLTYERTRPAPL